MGFTEGQVRDFAGLGDDFDQQDRDGLMSLLTDLKAAARPSQPALA